jgi:hypothetical protein
MFSYLEVVHEVLELPSEAGDDGGAGAVGGGSRAAARELAARQVLALKGLELALDGLGAAEDLLDLAVHAGAEGLDGAGVVGGLALLVRGLQAAVHALEAADVLLHDLHVLEELVQVGALAAGEAGLHLVHRNLLRKVGILLERA